MHNKSFGLYLISLIGILSGYSAIKSGIDLQLFPLTIVGIFTIICSCLFLLRTKMIQIFISIYCILFFIAYCVVLVIAIINKMHFFWGVGLLLYFPVMFWAIACLLYISLSKFYLKKI